MGEYADMAREQEEDAEWERMLSELFDRQKILAERFDANIWTTKDNRTIPLKEMTTKHIKNALLLINSGSRIFGFAEQWKPKLDEELERRNENV